MKKRWKVDDVALGQWTLVWLLIGFVINMPLLIIFGDANHGDGTWFLWLTLAIWFGPIFTVLFGMVGYCVWKDLICELGNPFKRVTESVEDLREHYDNKQKNKTSN